MTAGISGGDDYGTPRSLDSERRSICSYPFYALSDGLPRLSFSYHKLPPHLFKLSVVKLDGASFDVQISGNATVGELKQAVEDVFTQSPKEGEGTISWSHVWGHFCLCYRGQKLTNDKEYVRSFGIKDGDQLLFIRHLSMNYNLAKRRSKRDATWEEKPQPFAVSDISELEQSDDDFGDGDRYGKDSDGDRRDEDSENDQHAQDAKYYKFEANEDFIGHPEFKLAHFLKGWLSYSTLWIVGRKKSEGKFRASRFSGQFLRLGSKMTLTRL